MGEYRIFKDIVRKSRKGYSEFESGLPALEPLSSHSSLFPTAPLSSGAPTQGGYPPIALAGQIPTGTDQNDFILIEVLPRSLEPKNVPLPDLGLSKQKSGSPRFGIPQLSKQRTIDRLPFFPV
jgi:hypothetical protein